jgi:hypothetical protein
MPEIGSAAAGLAIALPLSNTGLGETDGESVGAVASRLIVNGAALVVKPASLVQEPLNAVPVVSVVCDCGPLQLTGALIESPPDVVIVTFVTYQLLVPSVPLVTFSATPVGPVLSSFTVRDVAFVVSPASFVHEPLNTVPGVSVV